VTQQISTTTQTKAEMLADRVPFLNRGRSKRDGRGFFLMPGSKEGVVYYSSALGCTCPGFRNRGVCCHQEACRIARNRAQNELITLAQRCRVADCGNMRESRTGRCAAHFQTLVDELGL
jgi:hypothetical protein